eukprot:365124-Chlamydomonas_euryale.AAC.20
MPASSTPQATKDDARLARIGEEYSSGRMLTGEIKAELISVLTDMVARHQQARAQVCANMCVRACMCIRAWACVHVHACVCMRVTVCALLCLALSFGRRPGQLQCTPRVCVGCAGCLPVWRVCYAGPYCP